MNLKCYIKKNAIIIVIAVIFLEVFIYNYRYWESLTFNHNSDLEITLADGTENDENKNVNITEDSADIEITDINEEVKNIYINLFTDTDSHRKGDSITIQIYETDAASATYSKLRETEIVYGIEESYYVRTHLVGESSKIKICVLNYEGHQISIERIAINANRPFILRKFRVLFFLVLLTLIALFKPGSPIYDTRLRWESGRQKLVILGIVAIHVILYCFIGHIFSEGDGWKNATWVAWLQYDYIAEAFTRGHVYIDQFEPPEALAEMDNPYDPGLRGMVMDESGETFIWDFAYYNGKYYSYFGVVPVILFYLPYLLITGEWLATFNLVILLTALFVITVFWFLYTLVKKKFPDISLGIYLLISILFIAASEVTYCVQKPQIYVVPIISGLLFDFAGLTCWLKASDGEGKVRKRWLITGAFSIAMTMGCRPQLAIVVLFAFPIFAKEIRERLFFSKMGMANTLCVIIPFIAVGVALMWYNYIRFGNPTDFGATYNLTSLDMNNRGFILDRFILGIWEYLFQPFIVRAKFPYFSVVATQGGLTTDYQGQVINEFLMAGFFAYNTIGYSICLIPRFRRQMKDRGIYWLSVCSILFAMTIMMVDTQMVGTNLRYLTDFSSILMIAVVLILLTLFDIYKSDNGYRTILLESIIIMTAICLFVNYFSLVAEGRSNELKGCDPKVYYAIKYQLFSIFSIR